MVDAGQHTAGDVVKGQIVWNDFHGSVRALERSGTPDLQSLADLSNSVTVVRNMRLAPISMRLFVVIGAAALTPMALLLLFDYLLTQLARMLLRKLAGL